MTIQEFYEINKQSNYLHEKRFYNPLCSLTDTLEENSPSIIQIVERCYNHAQLVQKAIQERERPTEGDTVIMPDNTQISITVRPFHTDKGLRFQGIEGKGYHHRTNDGIGSYSGTCGEAYTTSQFISTPQVDNKRAWIWAKGSAGAHRGMDYIFEVKVWRAL